MFSGCYNQISPNIPFKADLAVNAPLAKPIETVQKTIESSVNTLTGEKNSRKTRNAIAVGSSVIVLSALVALLNPRFSPKAIEKLKNLSQKAGNRAEKNKHDTLWNKFYKSCENILENGVKSIRFITNLNSGKDIAFKWFCTEEKNLLFIRNKSTRRVCKKVDKGIRKVLAKPHQAITNFFDNISKRTVLSKYSKASKKMNSLEELIASHKDKLSDSQKLELETKLAEIKKSKEYFSESQTRERFTQQEEAMSNLERDFLARYRAYKNGFYNRWQKKGDHISKNLSFWAEDILKPTKNKFETNGSEAVSKLVGNGSSQKGTYNEIAEMLAPHLSQEENALLNKQILKTKNSLQKANHSECAEYFDKKRDLVLGGAPTDVVTAIAGLGLSGIALSSAKDKDQRISRLLTGVFPIIGGLAASMVFTAMLVSGPVGMLAGTGIGLVLNKIGSFANKQILGNKEAEND